MRIDRRQQIVECIEEYSKQHGFPPTVRELCRMTGLSSTSSVHKYLVELKEQGVIQSLPERPRTLTLN